MTFVYVVDQDKLGNDSPVGGNSIRPYHKRKIEPEEKDAVLDGPIITEGNLETNSGIYKPKSIDKDLSRDMADLLENIVLLRQ